MNKLVSAIAACGALALLALPGTARSHVTFESGEVTPETPWRAVLRVPHGCAGAATTGLRIEMPEGVFAVQPMAKPGWDIVIEEGPYASSHVHHGRTVDRGVIALSWLGGPLPDAHYDEFVFRARISGDLAGRTLAFPVIQSCGPSAIQWTQVATGDERLSTPAPVVRVSGEARADGDAAVFPLGGLEIRDPWARESAGMAGAGAVFMTIGNAGGADRLVAASSPIADRVELHTHILDDGVMRMREVEGGIAVADGGVTVLEPGALHVMLLGLREPLRSGMRFPLSLNFERAGSVTVDVEVRPITAGAGGGGSDDHGHHDHGHDHGDAHGHDHEHDHGN